MFGAVLLSVSLAVFLAISGTAQRQIRMELAATGTVFDRVWSMRSERLREGAGLLSRDFGFREAAATADAATIGSALDNLRQRMGIDLAFMVDTEGRVFGAELSDADRVALVSAFNDSDDPSGVFLVGRQPYQLVTAPVLTPELIGWVGFAVRLDNREMRALEELAAIPLSAVVMHRSRDGAWSDASGTPELSPPRVQRFIEDSMKAKAGPVSLDLSSGQVVALVKPLRTMDPGGGATVLMLRYPLASALAPFRSLLIVVAILGLTGLVPASTIV